MNKYEWMNDKWVVIEWMNDEWVVIEWMNEWMTNEL